MSRHIGLTALINLDHIPPTTFLSNSSDKVETLCQAALNHYLAATKLVILLDSEN